MAATDSREIGLCIQMLRKARGMTQEQLAELADLSVSHVRQVELGAKNVSIAALYRIADALETPAQALLSGLETDELACLQALFAGCDPLEQRIIADVATAVIESLRKHRDARKKAEDPRDLCKAHANVTEYK